MIKVDNAIILAAGTSSRFAPLSYEKHKALTIVRDEVLIERQIKQLLEAGIKEIYIITGYKAEQFDYLVELYNVHLINNREYLTRNNNGSIWAARNVLCNSFVCSSDNYFMDNPFDIEVDSAYYAALYSDDKTLEWCMTEDDDGFIDSVSIGGEHAWYMMGHTFWDSAFSNDFLKILENEYNDPKTKNKLWEEIFGSHLDKLKMRIRKYNRDMIHEFDTFDELRAFDDSYINDSRSVILKGVAMTLKLTEAEIYNLISLKESTNEAIGFEFESALGHFKYLYEEGKITK